MVKWHHSWLWTSHSGFESLSPSQAWRKALNRGPFSTTSVDIQPRQFFKLRLRRATYPKEDKEGSLSKEESLFVAINYISCEDHYRERFEELFRTRARAIDRMPGFIRMHVLKPSKNGSPYLIVSEWEQESDFQRWTGSEEFKEGHQRGFEEIKAAKERGEKPPVSSRFLTYDVIAT